MLAISRRPPTSGYKEMCVRCTAGITGRRAPHRGAAENAATCKRRSIRQSVRRSPRTPVVPVEWQVGLRVWSRSSGRHIKELVEMPPRAGSARCGRASGGQRPHAREGSFIASCRPGGVTREPSGVGPVAGGATSQSCCKLMQQGTRMWVAKRRGQIIVFSLHWWSARRVFGGGLWAGVSPSEAAESRP